MGSGVALALLKKWPQVREKYVEHHQKMGWRLGYVQFVSVGQNRFVANCATQKTYLPRGRVHVDYEAVEQCMETLYRHCKKFNNTIAMPKIGSGLAGGDWKTIRKIIDKVFHDIDVYIYSID
jgi:O-acetyl-ADP-ribose deacetylase (regulator of RNase III)